MTTYPYSGSCPFCGEMVTTVEEKGFPMCAKVQCPHCSHFPVSISRFGE